MIVQLIPIRPIWKDIILAYLSLLLFVTKRLYSTITATTVSITHSLTFQALISPMVTCTSSESESSSSSFSCVSPSSPLWKICYHHLSNYSIQQDKVLHQHTIYEPKHFDKMLLPNIRKFVWKISWQQKSYSQVCILTCQVTTPAI